ncbi:MAG TPA: tetratricopeptide repeat protein [Pyrinomonadaceae bacterium]|nr:tetratricopeptide repeat protein [Pyrinomonadaceae bacterium]
MSAPDNLHSTIDAGAESPEIIVRRLVRALDFAECFWLGFVKSNLHAQRLNAVAACKELLDALNIHLVEIELDGPVNDLLPILKDRLSQERRAIETSAHAPRDEVEPSRSKQHKIVFFVYGLEHSIPSSDAYPPILASFNLNRELFRQDITCPLVLWLADYALTALARGAPDFWAWRSGLYEFAPEVDITERTFEPIHHEEEHLTSSLSERAKRERLTMLKGLLADYCELGDGARERKTQIVIQSRIGAIYSELGEWGEAKRVFEKALEIAREQADSRLIASTSHNLGFQLRNMGDYVSARQLLEESLKIERGLNNMLGVATSLQELGSLAYVTEDFSGARSFYEESLKISREQNDRRKVASALWGLAIILHDEDKIDEARDLYEQALNTFYEMGDKKNIACVLYQLGTLSATSDNYSEAKQFYQESLTLAREIGFKQVRAASLQQLGILAGKIGDYVEARKFYEDSLSVKRDLEDRDGEARMLSTLGFLDVAEGKYSEGIERLRKAEKLILELDDKEFASQIRIALNRLEENPPSNSKPLT